MFFKTDQAFLRRNGKQVHPSFPRSMTHLSLFDLITLEVILSDLVSFDPIIFELCSFQYYPNRTAFGLIFSHSNCVHFDLFPSDLIRFNLVPFELCSFWAFPLDVFILFKFCLVRTCPIWSQSFPIHSNKNFIEFFHKKPTGLISSLMS